MYTKLSNTAEKMREIFKDQIHCSFKAKNVLVRKPNNDSKITYAPFQIEIDELSEIRKTKYLLEPEVESLSLKDIISERMSSFVDVCAVVTQDGGWTKDDKENNRPRKLTLEDETGDILIWTLWNLPYGDATENEKIQKLIGKPVFLRKARTTYFDIFNENQVNLPLQSALTNLDAHEKMKELKNLKNEKFTN